MIKLNRDRSAAVNTQTFWVEIAEANKPLKGARYLLINKAAGVAQIAPFTDDGWYTHYAGLPSFGSPVVAGVPRRPTEAMIQAGRDTPVAEDCDDDAEDYAAVWTAMYDAAPRPDPKKPTYEELESRIAHLEQAYEYLAEEYGELQERWQ
jgi:hypothetical protein